MPEMAATATAATCAFCGRRRFLSAITTMEIILLAAMILAGSPRTHFTTAMTTAAEDLDDIWNGLQNGLHDRSTSRRRELYHLDVTEAGEPCTPSPLWKRVVDPANYEYGCREIESMLAGEMILVGNGHVRDVYFVEYEGRKLVLKTLRNVVDDERSQMGHLDRHRREVFALDAMRGHPNIVGMLGVCGTVVVTEYFSTVFQDIFSPDKDMPIRQVVSMALVAARGLQALHELAGAIHVDLKPQQLLIHDSGRVMLNDFNSVLIMSVSPAGDGTRCPAQSGKRKKHTPWPSPENYAGQPLTTASDVYSMGFIFYSLIARRLPYSGDKERLKTAMATRGRPEIDPSWHQGFMKVVQEMWDEDPTNRPSAGQIVVRLQRIEKELSGEATSLFG